MKIIADLDASRVQKQLANLTKDQKMDIVADVAIKNKNALDSLMNDVNQLQSRLAKDFNINITSRQAVQAFNQIDKSISKTQKQIQSIQSDYWKQTFDNQFASRHTTSPELKEMRSYYSQLEKESLQVQKQIQSIQKQASSGLFEYRNAKNRSFLDRYVGQDSEALSRARKQIEEIKNLQSQISSGNLDGDKLTSLYAQLNEQVEKLSYSMRQVAEEQSKTLAVGVADTSANKVKSYMEANTKALSKYRAELESLEKSYRSMTTQGEKLDLDNQFRNLQSRISSEGLTGKSAIDDFKRAFGQIAQFAGAYGLIQNVVWQVPQQMVQAVRDINAAQIELKKVTDASDMQLAQYWDEAAASAEKYGAKINEVINSTADWQRLGYNLEDSKVLSDATTLMQRIGDNMTQQSSSEGLISTLQGFQLEAEEVNRIVDEVNEVANTQPIDTAGIFAGLQRSASSMSAANNTLEETIALITAGNAVIQDPDRVGNGLKTISMRIRGATTELEAAGESTEGMAKSTASLRKEVMALAGVDIMQNETTFKSTYQILDELSERWSNLTDIEQASLTELLAGRECLPEHAEMCA